MPLSLLLSWGLSSGYTGAVRQREPASRARRRKKLMRESLKRMLLIGMMALLALTAFSCASATHGLNVPEPSLDYGWYPTREMEKNGLHLEIEMKNGEIVRMKCVTDKDKEKIDKWIGFLRLK